MCTLHTSSHPAFTEVHMQHFCTLNASHTLHGKARTSPYTKGIDSQA